MKCPRTGADLNPIKVGGITVDISDKCGGVFFKNNEVEKFDEKTKIRGGLLVHHLKQFTPPALDLTKKITCPKCRNVVMKRSFYSTNNEIEIDTCPSCDGLWFDFGELEKVRNLVSISTNHQTSSQKFETMLLNSEAYQEYKDALDKEVQESERFEKANQLHLFLFNSLIN